MKRSLAVLAVVLWARTAAADPTFTVDDKDLEAGMASFAEQLDEPVGMLVIARSPKLGLEKNDIVRAINGEPASKSGMRGLRHDSATLMYLDVLRGKKELVVRIRVKISAAEEHLERDRYKEELDRLHQFGATFALVQVTKDGNPSGVELKMPWFMMSAGPTEGDIIRRIDKRAISTVDEMMAALEAGKDQPKVVIEADRLGQPLTFTLDLDDPPKEDPAIAAGIAQIRKLDDSTYEVPKSLVDALLSSPAIVSARIVPAIKNGQPEGYKLYAIRSNSVFSALGLSNGDTIQKIAGVAVDDHSVDIRDRIRKAKTVKVELTRRGTALTIEYHVIK